MAKKPAPKQLPPWLQKKTEDKETGKHEQPKTVKKPPPKKKGY
jgi:hypothetical protein